MAAIEPKPCGTRAGYQSGCKCPDCKAANASYAASRRRSPSGFVAVGKVRTHLAELQAAGLSLAEIARRAEMEPRTVQRIAAGMTTGCTPESRSRIMGVLPPRDTRYISLVPDVDEPPEPSYDDKLALLRLECDPAELVWRADAECTRLDLTVEQRQRWFFPMRGESVDEALAVCRRCPVVEPCLEHALTYNEQGVWGATTGSHRRDIKHERAEAERAQQ